MARLTIDADFIKTWKPRYKASEHDEPKYNDIIENAREDIERTNTLSKETFRCIYQWKTRGRSTRHVDWRNYSRYAEAIRKCLAAPEDSNIVFALGKLDGVGTPVASTILHFIFPREYPIIDVRTVGVLHYGGYIKSKGTDAKHYDEFRKEMLEIARRCHTHLREVDEALFAYHKLKLSKK